MKNPIMAVLLAVAGILLTTGCATSRKALEPSVPPPFNDATARRVDALFSLLSAELAGQRGHFDAALKGYLDAARSAQDPRIAERATQIALAAKQPDLALEAAQLWRAQDPDNTAARKVLLSLYLKNGAKEHAVAELEALLQSGGDVDGLLMDVARVLGAELPKEESLGLMAYLVERFPQHAEMHFAYAVLAMNLDETRLALDEVNKALELRRNWSRARGLQAQLAARAGDSRLARAILEKALRNEPGNVQLRLILAEQLMRLNDFRGAESQFRRVLRKQPDHEDASFGLAMALLQGKREEAARAVLQPLAENSRWRSQASYYLGLLEVQRKRWGEAVEWFDAVEGGPLALEAQLNAVAALIAANQDAEAIERLHQLRKRIPGEALRFYLMEAELLTRRDNQAGAFDVLSQALGELPGRHELLYTRALVAERLDRLDVLEADLTAILKENPDDANALNALGYTLVDKTSRFHEAQRYLERALELKPEDPAILDSYGWLQYRLGNPQSAVSYLRRAYERTHDAEIAAHLGEVLWTTGRKEEARTIWRKAMQKEPENEYIQRAREHFPEAFE
ncbi:MAG TPA: tetratricopeptide repeat protein [Methylococcaceae bacterium]|nr:tetratricopeptide repeat protein [Methylococcaceae bacterium]